MAGGWAADGAVQEQIDASIQDAVAKARSQLGKGPARLNCEECGDPIPEARRQAVSGVRFCVSCQQSLDAAQSAQSGYNRRGSKDSQLR